MKLNILERLLGIGLIIAYESEHPKGNFITLKTVNLLQNKLLVNEEEVKKYNLRIEDNQYKWDDAGSLEYTDFDLTEGEKKILVEGLVILNKTEQLTKEHNSLIDKLVPDPESTFALSNE